MSESVAVKLTSAIGIAGVLVRAGEVIEVSESAAKDLLRRGKAELATEEDEPQHQPESLGDKETGADQGDNQDQGEQASHSDGDGEQEHETEGDAAPAPKSKSRKQ